jgi:type IV pilus assembly protein PilA
MLQMLRKRLNKDEEGFTLIELMVVVLIIAILLAIAIPTFLGARTRAQNRAAESILRNALTAEKTVYTDAQFYNDSTVTGSSSLSSVEPSLTWQAGTATAASNQIQVTTKDQGTGLAGQGNELCIQTKSASGNEYGIIDIAETDATFTQAGTWYYKNTSGTAMACTGAATDLAVANQPANSTLSQVTGSGGAGW